LNDVNNKIKIKIDMSEKVKYGL